MEYELEHGPSDPITGVVTSLVGTLGGLAVSAADLPTEVFHTLKTKVHRNSTDTDTDKMSMSSASSRKSETISSRISLETRDDPMHEAEPVTIDIQETLTAHPDNTDIASQKNITVSNVIRDPTVEAIAITSKPGPRSLEAIAATHPHLSPETISRMTAHSDTHEKKQGQEIKEKVIDSIVHAAEVGLSAPMNLAESIAQGFRNVPRLYGDDTVRPQENITGFQSGLKAAGLDFAHGICDGVTGVVTQPINGGKERGIGGFAAGVGKGLGGQANRRSGPFIIANLQLY